MFQVAANAYRSGNLKRAEQGFEKVLEQSPGHDRALYNLAMVNL